MIWFRRIGRILVLFIVTVSYYAVFLAGALFRSGDHRIRWRNRVVSNWAAVAARSLSLDIEVHGNAPKPPFFLVCNHLSYIDILPLFRELDGTFVAMQEVRSWPLIGRISRSIGVLFIDRDKREDARRVNRILTATRSPHQGIILFPEGGTSSGESLRRFRSALLEPPASEGWPVHYAAISYTTGEGDPPAHESVCWWGGISFAAHAWRLTTLRSIRCRLKFAPEPVYGADRKELAENLQARVEKLLFSDETGKSGSEAPNTPAPESPV